MLTTTAIRARAISKHFGEVVALDGVDLDVGVGRIHGLVGPNGAGKTTLLGLLLGLGAADAGELEVLGSEVTGSSGAPAGVSGFLDGPGLYPGLTARRNVALAASLHGGRIGRAAVDRALHDVGLRDVADDRVRGFSLGMRQRLGLACALVTGPRLLVLDEPSNGLDPAAKRHVHDLLRQLAADGTTVVLSSHRVDDVEALCSEVTILVTGRVVFSGPLADLASGDRPLEHRLVVSDPAAARAFASGSGDVELVEGFDAAAGGAAPSLVVRASAAALEELVVALVLAGFWVREVTPLISPLEAAFLAVTEPAGAAR